MTSKFSLLPALLMLMLAIAACKSDSTGTSNTTTGTIPTVGSRYTFRDSSTGFVVPASNITYLVVQSSGNIFVWKQDTTGNPFADSSQFWFKMDANGDIEENPSPVSMSRAGWFTMPYGTKSLVTSRQTELNGSSIDTVITSAEGESDGTFNVGGKQYTTKRVRVTMTRAPQTGTPHSNVYHYQYSPDLGVEVAYDEDDWNVQGAIQEAHHFRLKAIDKK